MDSWRYFYPIIFTLDALNCDFTISIDWRKSIFIAQCPSLNAVLMGKYIALFGQPLIPKDEWTDKKLIWDHRVVIFPL